MQLQIHLEAVGDQPSPDVDTLLSLQRWLVGEPDVVQSEIGLSTAAPRPGELGGAVEIISLVLGTGLSVGQLLLAVSNWRRTRPVAPAVILTRIDPDGVSVRIESADPAAVAAAARALDG
ncbi:effector-associated constant component EACC1 [Dactylosporangium sp. CA-139066]|uniref:effector-associated constant component EACC1 n=1 Tax=Dactylosporangium sp. CA-139066 TaxID=3239930 RepID=UPI003D8CFB19